MQVDKIFFNHYHNCVDDYDKLNARAAELGADLFGVSETAKISQFLDPEIRDVARDLPFTISIAIRLHRRVFDSLIDGPNILYKHHYRTANFRLDSIIFRLGNFIQNAGYASLPIPASVYTDRVNQKAHLSHRHAAINAGLGFQGLNGLLVHPEYGAAVRLASLLTDMPLRSDSPLEADCGNCRACVTACPVNAISELGPGHFNGRACYEKLKKNLRQQGIGVYICGLCIKACPGLRQRG